MRSIRIDYMIVALIFVCTGSGCGRSNTTPEVVAKPQLRQSNMTYQIKWPGQPSESTQVLPTADGNHVHYAAQFADHQPGSLTLYSVFTHEYPEKARRELAPKEWVTAHLHAFQNDDISRKEVEYGPKKYVGLDVNRRTPRGFNRILVINSGRHLFDVSVNVPREDMLASSAVTEFFNSFVILE